MADNLLSCPFCGCANIGTDGEGEQPEPDREPGVD